MTQIPIFSRIVACLAAVTATALAQNASFAALSTPRTPADEEEYFYLDQYTEPGQWLATEAEARQGEPVNGHPTLIFHIDVDHHAGEPKYPIGWPRIYLKKPGDIPWKDYDMLEFKVRASTSAPPLPGVAFNMKFTGTPKANIDIRFGQKELKPNEWFPFSFQLNKIAAFQSFSNSGFFISESNYADKTVLDFTFAEARLVRSAACKITEMEVQGANYATATRIPVKLTVFGPASDAARGVPFQITQGDKLIRRETLPVARGTQMLEMDISELRLAPGDYGLTAFPDHPERRLTVTFKLIASPF